MKRLEEAVERFVREFGPRLREAKNLLADTRVPLVSLYDHLVLTAGFSVAMVEELLRRGKGSDAICGFPLETHELRALARFGGLLHDIGKAKMGATEYRCHVQRGIEVAQELLKSFGLEKELSAVLLGIVERHHIQDGPISLLEKVVCLADGYASAGDRPELSKGETQEEFERVTRKTLELEKELFGDQPPVAFLMADVDSVKSYVYETRSLPEIRGGSEILQDLEEEIRNMFRKRLAEECLLYCGGGGLLAILPASSAKAWAEEIEELYPKHTRAATVTVVTSPPLGYREVARGLFPYDTERVAQLKGQGVAQDLLFSHFEALVEGRGKRKNFGEIVARLSSDLQRKKREKRYVPLFEALPFHARCTSCGKRPGEKEDFDDLLCGVCSAKRQRGREGRHAFVESFEEFLLERGISLPEEGLKHPKDLEALVQGETRIAFFYADGNNMGDVLQRASSPAFYRHFSETLRGATREALFLALLRTFGPSGLWSSQSVLPFEIVALGGDDVAAIVPGSAGWSLALQFLKAFEEHRDIERLRREIGQSSALTMSAGLSIADVKYPVGFLLGITESLLKEAKRLARDTQKSTLCHLWLKASVITEGGEKLLATLYRRSNGTVLTGRPYTLDDALRLTEITKNLKNAGA